MPSLIRRSTGGGSTPAPPPPASDAPEATPEQGSESEGGAGGGVKQSWLSLALWGSGVKGIKATTHTPWYAHPASPLIEACWGI
jgi:hypothetical protein